MPTYQSRAFMGQTKTSVIGNGAVTSVTVNGSPVAFTIFAGQIVFQPLNQGDALEVTQQDGQTSGQKQQDIVSVISGKTLAVAPFAVGAVTYPGGTVTVPTYGLWFVGLDLFTGNLLTLTRLGHRGWIPLARVVATADSISSINNIAPSIFDCRTPNFTHKIVQGLPTTVAVIGSSLSFSDGTPTNWGGMVAGPNRSPSLYGLPGNVTAKFLGVGGSPNEYQLAQLGIASAHTGTGEKTSSGYPLLMNIRSGVNGRSALFNGVDLAIVCCLANRIENYLAKIEPIVRRLRERGIEVILTTDNPINPSSDYATMMTSDLYIDGPEVMRIADLYGCELADTAAYVVDAYMRQGEAAIYLDDGIHTHMKAGTAAGRNAVPANGHEVWARAVRSVITVDTILPAPVVNNFTFDSSTQGWVGWNGGTVTASGGKLVATASGGFQGTEIVLPVSCSAGDTIKVNLDATSNDGSNLRWGLENDGQGGDLSSSNGQTFTIVASKSLINLPIYIARSNAGTLSIDNVTVTVTAQSGSIKDRAAGRGNSVKSLPPCRTVENFSHPGDAFVILPGDERNVSTGAAKAGTLSAHPFGAESFARQFYPSTDPAKDLLTLTPGQEAVVSANGMVALSVIRFVSGPTEANVIGSIYRNGAKAYDFNLPPSLLTGAEFLQFLIPPSVYLSSSPTDNGCDSLKVTISSGILKVAAFVATTADITFVTPEKLQKRGTFGFEIGASGAPSYFTDTQGDFVAVENTGKRAQFLIQGTPGTQPTLVFSGTEQAYYQNSGASSGDVLSCGGLLAPNQPARLYAVQGQATPSNGHAMSVIGALLYNDR